MRPGFGKIVKHIDNFLGLIAELRVFRFRIGGEIRGRVRKIRIRAQDFANIRSAGCAVRFRDAQIANAAGAISHQGDTVLPTYFIATNRGNFCLQSMATHTSEKQQLLSGALGQQSLAFVNGKIGPSDHPFLQREIESCCFVRIDFHTVIFDLVLCARTRALLKAEPSGPLTMGSFPAPTILS